MLREHRSVQSNQDCQSDAELGSYIYPVSGGIQLMPDVVTFALIQGLDLGLDRIMR